MSYIIDRLKNLGLFNYPDNEEEKEIITGYSLMTDSNKTLIMIKTNENSWKTKWFQTNSIKINVPELPIQSIFKTKV